MESVVKIDNKLYMKALSNKLKDLFLKHKRYYPLDQSDEGDKSFLRGLEGVSKYSRTIYFNCDKSWSVNVNLTIEVYIDYVEAIPHLSCSPTLGWSSSSRNLAKAEACLTLYREMMRFATLVKDEMETSSFGHRVYHEYKALVEEKGVIDIDETLGEV